MSFGQAWQGEHDPEPMHYRLVAGVIELLPEIEMTAQEMQRVGWRVEQGRDYLKRHFAKESCYTCAQLSCSIATAKPGCRWVVTWQELFEKFLVLARLSKLALSHQKFAFPEIDRYSPRSILIAVITFTDPRASRHPKSPTDAR
jgi:hypothetical protein